MANRVNVSSIEAIDSFRANLILYLAKARATLEEVHAEVARTRVWVRSNQRIHWEETFKRRARQLEEAQAALFGSKMSTFRKVSTSEQMAVAKAKHSKDEAEAKLRLLRKWDRDFDNLTDPFMRSLENLGGVLADDMARAVHYLTQTLTTLDDYTGTIAPGIAESASPPSAPKTDENPASPEENPATPAAALAKGNTS